MIKTIKKPRTVVFLILDIVIDHKFMYVFEM